MIYSLRYTNKVPEDSAGYAKLKKEKRLKDSSGKGKGKGSSDG